jgi:hypothetical protein
MDKTNFDGLYKHLGIESAESDVSNSFKDVKPLQRQIPKYGDDTTQSQQCPDTKLHLDDLLLMRNRLINVINVLEKELGMYEININQTNELHLKLNSKLLLDIKSPILKELNGILN